MSRLGGPPWLYYLLIINMLAFLSMGIDKSKARRQAWRIPERTLFFLAAIGGTVGIWLGMFFFHHKTKHPAFLYGIPALGLAQLVALYLILL